MQDPNRLTKSQVRQLNKHFSQYGLKYCPGCPGIIQFQFFTNLKNGLCQKCAAQGTAQWREQNPEREKANNRRIYQENSQRAKDYSNRWYRENKDRAKETKRNWREVNREKIAKAHRRWYVENKNRVYESNRIWRINNPEKRRKFDSEYRARLAEAATLHVTAEQLNAKYAYWGDCCYICGRDGVALTLDHVKPLAAGGSNMLCNYRPSCGPCNSSKRDRWFGVSGLADLIDLVRSRLAA